MADSITHTVASQLSGVQSTTVDRKNCALDAVRKCVADEGEGPVSLGAHMGTDKSYPSRVLNGESNLSVWFILKLPIPVKKRLAKFWFEYLGGVGEYPDTDEKTALRHQVMALQLELKMAKAELVARQVEKVG